MLTKTKEKKRKKAKGKIFLVIKYKQTWETDF